MSPKPNAVDAKVLLRVRNLSVNYVPDAIALREVGFELNAGETVGILGESGSGKSTLASSLLGLLPTSSKVEGSVRYRDQELLKLDGAGWRLIRGAEIAMIFQEPGLSFSPVLRIGNQITDVMRAHRRGTREQLALECKELLRRMRLAEIERIFRAYPHQLSLGQLQRAAIARALACRPALLIADEPTRSLDATVQNEVVNLLRELKQELGFALIFITHNPALLAGFADRIMVMYAGEVVEDGPAQKILRQPCHPYTEGLLQLARRIPSTQHAARRLPAIPGSLSDSLAVTRGCRFEPRCAARMAVCREQAPAEFAPESNHRVTCLQYAN